MLVQLTSRQEPNTGCGVLGLFLIRFRVQSKHRFRVNIDELRSSNITVTVGFSRMYLQYEYNLSKSKHFLLCILE